MMTELKISLMFGGKCNMYEEKQDSNELTYQSYVGAKNWLSKWEKLYIKYNDK